MKKKEDPTSPKPSPTDHTIRCPHCDQNSMQLENMKAKLYRCVICGHQEIRG